MKQASKPSSLLKKTLYSYLVFGLGVALVFPFYANLFVDWKPGMLPWFVFGCIVAGLLIGVSNYWLLNKILLKRLKVISEVALSISNKDLSQNCTLDSADTIGEIITSFNKMADTLRELLGQVIDSSDDVHQGSSTIVDYMRRIQQNHELQHLKSNEISLAILNLAANINENNAYSTEAAKGAREAVALAQHGGKVVEQTVQGMMKIESSVQLAADSIQVLNSHSENISRTASRIKEISIQTNLLALNATLEATQAGVHGRGFSVVALEVRTLAKRVAEATSEINALVSDIVSQTTEATRCMDNSLKEVRLGVNHATMAGKSLFQIVGSVALMEALILNVGKTSDKQRHDVGQVKTNIGEISKLVNDNSSVVDQGEQASNKLDELSASLNRLVKVFKLIEST